MADEISVEELAEDIEMLIWEHGIEFFKISEEIAKRAKCSYLVRGLNIGIEDDYVFSTDFDNIICENFHAMMLFLKESIITINRIVTNEYRKGILNFQDGTISIEVSMID